MTTSGITSYQATRDLIITEALRLVGGVATGETPSTYQISESADALNLMVLAWQADGMPLWALKQYNFSLTDNTNSYEIGIGKTLNVPKPLKIIQAWRRTSSNIDIPLTTLTKNSYNLLSSKTSTGVPTQYYYDPQNLFGTIFIWPTPLSTTDSIYIVYQRPFEDFNASTDTPDFPQEWHEALIYGLAVRLAPKYGMPPMDRRELKEEANAIRGLALSFGTEEGSFRIIPEKQYG